MKERNTFLILVIFTLLVCMVTLNFGQQGRGKGRIRGTVADDSGNPLKDVKITAEHLDYKTKFESKSNKKGNWAIGGLGSGYFLIVAQLEGYEPFTLELQVSQFSQNNAPVNITLKKVVIQEGTAIQDEIGATLLKEGNQLFEAKKYEQAVAKFEELLEKTPSFYQVQINIGNCYKEMGEYDRAIAVFETMLEKAKQEKNSFGGDENVVHALAGIGEVYILKNDVDKAKNYLQQAIDIFPGDETMIFKIGEIFFKQGEAAKGIEYYDKAIQINSDWTPPYRQRGYAYLNLTNYSMAIESFKKFLELAPDDPQASIIKDLIPKLEEMIKK